MPHPLRRLASRSVAALVMLAACAPLLHAQAASRATIDPGMTRAQVEELLGTPKVVREARSATYLFYANQCGRTCGTDDLVVLEGNAVADAVFRSPGRHYSGRSSSPAALTSASARPARVALERPAAARAPGDAAGAAPRGSFVIGGAPPPPDGERAASARRREAARRAAGARRATHGSTLLAPRRTSAIRAATVPDAHRLGPSSGGPSAAEPQLINAARTGARTSTGPVDARAVVQNAGAPLYPKATGVSASPARSAADSAASDPVPLTGAQLAPADSALGAARQAVRAEHRPATAPVTRPVERPSAPRPDSNRP